MLNLQTKSEPCIKTLNKNSYYLGLLKNLYSGSEGECACFLQFSYQYYTLCGFNLPVAEEINKIRMEDLNHQKMLANAILMTGGDPVFSNAQNKWFCTNQIDYIKNINQILSFNIELKEKVIIDYKLAISKIDNMEIKNLLCFIVKEEETHLKFLKNELEKIK